MKYQPKFKEPKNKEEKLICELSKNLHETAHVFINLNKYTCGDNEIFIVLRDGSLAFAGQTIDALVRVMADESQKLLFLKECQDIFNCYIEQASNGLIKGQE